MIEVGMDPEALTGAALCHSRCRGTAAVAGGSLHFRVLSELEAATMMILEVAYGWSAVTSGLSLSLAALAPLTASQALEDFETRGKVKPTFESSDPRHRSFWPHSAWQQGRELHPGKQSADACNCVLLNRA